MAGENTINVDELKNGYDPFADIMATNLPEKKEEEVDPTESNEQKPAQKPNNNGKEESIKALRDKKDKLERELNEARERAASLEEFTSFKEVRDYLKQKTGKDKITEEEVRSYIAKNKDRKEKLTKLEKAFAEKEAQIKELSIEHSDEWKSIYVKGIQDSITNINVTVANYDSDGKPRAPELTNKFIRSITNLNEDGTPKNAIQIKSMLSAFRKEYFDATGMDYEAPSIPELVKSVENINSSIAKANEARKNWDLTQDQIKKERIYNQAQEQKRKVEIEKTNRDLMVKDYRSTEEFQRLNTELDNSYETFLQEEHSFMNQVLEDPSKGQRGYNQLVASLAKAKLVDKAMDIIKQKDAEITKLKQQIEKGRPPRGGPTKPNQSSPSGNESRIDLDQLQNGYDPLKELQ